MASINVRTKSNEFTHEGAPTIKLNPLGQLKRSVMCCLLWENQFYEDGISIADRIQNLVPLVKPSDVYNIALDARNKYKLRHVPLLIARIMAKQQSHKKLVSKLLYEIIKRPDELTELLAIYWKDGREKLSAQIKKGLAKAFTKFNEYQLAKYNRDKSIKLKDVLFLTHPKPRDEAQQDIWNRLIKDKLKIPDTWEVEISKNKNNKQSWERLIKENKLGGMALIRNLRNMIEAKVDEELIKNAILSMKTDEILPFRFIAAARYAPKFEAELEIAMLKAINSNEKKEMLLGRPIILVDVSGSMESKLSGKKEMLLGRTILLVDVSGSMESKLSEKGDMLRIDAACGVGIIVRELCEKLGIYSFSNECKVIPNRRGFALRDAIVNSQRHSGTYMGMSINYINESTEYDRIIVITDEQSHDEIPKCKGVGYIINIASCKNGIGYDKNYIHISGWSESVIDFIIESEKEYNNEWLKKHRDGV